MRAATRNNGDSPLRSVLAATKILVYEVKYANRSNVRAPLYDAVRVLRGNATARPGREYRLFILSEKAEREPGRADPGTGGPRLSEGARVVYIFEGGPLQRSRSLVADGSRSLIVPRATRTHRACARAAKRWKHGEILGLIYDYINP